MLGDTRMKKISIVLAIALLIIAIAPATFTQQKAERKSKMTRQTLTVDGEEVTIMRDDYGVPHIFARTARGVHFGGGFAVAQDRLYQMERYRHDARGQMAEIEGPAALARDQQVRTIGYTEDELQSFFNAL